MRYYIIDETTDKIIDQRDGECPDPQEQADYFDCPIYIIEGQHTGLSAAPNKAVEPDLLTACKALVKAVRKETENTHSAFVPEHLREAYGNAAKAVRKAEGKYA